MWQWYPIPVSTSFWIAGVQLTEVALQMHYKDFPVCSFFNFGSLLDSYSKSTAVEHRGKQTNKKPQQKQNPQCNE